MNPPIENFKCISIELQSLAANLAARAYFDNPAHIFLCPSERSRLIKLEWLLGLNLNMQLKYGAKSFCYTENGKILSMGFWTEVENSSINTLTKIKEGLLRIPFKFGISGFRRVLIASNKIESHLKKSMVSTENCLQLNYFVMEENRRCKGWGSKILSHQLNLLKKDMIYSSAVLNTQRYWTVKFYEKHGFKIIHQEKIGYGPRAFTNWTMQHKFE